MTNVEFYARLKVIVRLVGYLIAVAALLPSPRHKLILIESYLQSRDDLVHVVNAVGAALQIHIFKCHVERVQIVFVEVDLAKVILFPTVYVLVDARVVSSVGLVLLVLQLDHAVQR